VSDRFNIQDSPLYNEDLAPVPPEKRTWNRWHIASLWVGMAVCIPTYMLAADLIKNGMNWWQALLTILLGNLIVLIPMILNAHVGTKYGIPLPVFLRLSFGIQGAILASVLRALVACGWFGIQTWIGGLAIYQMLMVFFPQLSNSPSLGTWIGLNLAQGMCFAAFWLLNLWIVYRGIESIKLLELWAAPFLILLGLALLLWAWLEVGSMKQILNASYQLSEQRGVNFWKLFFPSLTAMVGFWATVSLNIPDFTRYAKSQKDQVWGQILGLPTTMALYSFIGIAVTCATVLIFQEAIWNPIELLGKFSNPFVVVISLLGLTIATLSTNIAANVVAPANAFTNVAPRIISFRMGGYITGLIGVMIFPWKLLSNLPDWLIAYSALLGALAGIMICDYYVIRKRKIEVEELFNPNGRYQGWNTPAWIAFVVSLIPVLPGFLNKIGFLKLNEGTAYLNEIYSYAWFVTFGIAFFLYAILKRSDAKGGLVNES
jgi:NCS1 family nucleobase:cation symporter-1